MRRVILAALLVLLAAQPARAEIALLASGTTLKVEARRTEGALVFLTLKGGGEFGVPAWFVLGVVPDEVVDEVRDRAGDIRLLAEAAALRHGLDPGLVLAVAQVESGLKPEAVSPKGAQGLMQLMPKTAASLGVTDPFDPVQSLDGGAQHLGALLRGYAGDLEKALAAYNAGESAVARYRGVPPFRETQSYVKKVLHTYEKEPSGGPRTPLPAVRERRARPLLPR